MADENMIARDLATAAADRATRAMRDALCLCETRKQHLAVAVQVFAQVAGAACGVIAAQSGVDPKDVTAEEMLPILLELSREAKAARTNMAEDR